MSYTQQNFKNGDVLNAENLVKIEEAIINLDDETSALGKRTISVKLSKDGIQYKNPGATDWTVGEGNFSFLTPTSFKGTQIPANANLDNYTNFGNYIGSGDQVSTITNRPETASNLFYLQTVQMLLENQYMVQIYTVTPSGDMYYRYKNNTNKWKKWSKIIDVYHPIEDVTTRDLNQFYSEKKWRCSDSIIIATIVNKPVEISYPFELEVARTEEGAICQNYRIPSKGICFTRICNKVSDWSQWEKTSLNGDICSYDAFSSTIENNPWRVTRIEDLIFHNGSFYTYRDLKITSNDIISTTKNNNTIYSSPVKTIPLQMPVEGSRATIFGSVNEGKGYIGSTLIKNKVQLQFQAHSPFNDLAYSNTTLNNVYKIAIIGQRATPPNYTIAKFNATSSDIKSKIKDIVQTYFTARDNGAKFKWGTNWFSNYYSYENKDDGLVIDSNDYRLLQCDSFVGCILMGQTYDDIYSGMGRNSTRNFATFFSEKNLTGDLQWAFCNKKNETSDNVHDPIYENMVACSSYNNFKICYSGLQAWFFWNQKRVFSTDDFNNLATGDIIFLRKKSDSSKTFFDNIIHLGILTVDNGIVYINQIGTKMDDTGKLGGDCALSRVPLKQYLNLTIHAPDMEYYFARPDYNNRQNRANIT